MIHVFKFQNKLNKDDKNTISRESAEIKHIGKIKFLSMSSFESSRIKIIYIPNYFWN